MKRLQTTNAVRRSLRGDYVPDDVHLYRIDRHTFTVYVSGDPSAEGHADEGESLGEPGVEFNMADRLERNLNVLSGIDPQRPILVNMSSCGGDWDAGMQMFSAILMCPNPVTVLATKWARSMTSIIPLAADRFAIRPPAQYMFHYGTYGFNGLNQEAETNDIERRKANERMKRIYIARLQEQGCYKSNDEKTMRMMLEDRLREHIDVWLSADEAKRWGFADLVFEGDYTKLRAAKRNVARRARMLAALRSPIKVRVSVT